MHLKLGELYLYKYLKKRLDMSGIQNKVTQKVLDATSQSSALTLAQNAEKWYQNSKNIVKSLIVPSIKHEEWKYSNVERVLSQFEFTNNEFKLTASINSNASDNIILLKNGLVESISLTPEMSKMITVLPLDQALTTHTEMVNGYFGKHTEHRNEFFTHLNNAAQANGLFVFVAANTEITTPIYIIEEGAESPESMMQSHHLFIIEENATVTFINKQNNAKNINKSFINSVTEVFIGDKSTFNLDRLQNDSAKTSMVSNFYATLGESSILDLVNVQIGSEFTRNNYTVFLNGEYGNAQLAGLFVGRNQQHADSFVLMNHNQPNCESTQIFKSIVDDASTSVFSGKIYVDPIAQKTNAYQSNKNVVLNDEANAYSQPQLEIYADDVRCSHGSTTGHLDEDALFYLRSRGISESSARKLLLFSFAESVVERIHSEEFHTEIQQLVFNQFDN